MAGPDPAAALAKALHELSVREATQALAAKTFTAEAYVDALLDWQRGILKRKFCAEGIAAQPGKQQCCQRIPFRPSAHVNLRREREHGTSG